MKRTQFMWSFFCPPPSEELRSTPPSAPPLYQTSPCCWSVVERRTVWGVCWQHWAVCASACECTEHPLSRWVCWKGVGEVGKGQMEHRRKFTSNTYSVSERGEGWWGRGVRGGRRPQETEKGGRELKEWYAETERWESGLKDGEERRRGERCVR